MKTIIIGIITMIVLSSCNNNNNNNNNKQEKSISIKSIFDGLYYIDKNHNSVNDKEDKIMINYSNKSDYINLNSNSITNIIFEDNFTFKSNYIIDGINHIGILSTLLVDTNNLTKINKIIDNKKIEITDYKLYNLLTYVMKIKNQSFKTSYTDFKFFILDTDISNEYEVEFLTYLNVSDNETSIFKQNNKFINLLRSEFFNDINTIELNKKINKYSSFYEENPIIFKLLTKIDLIENYDYLKNVLNDSFYDLRENNLKILIQKIKDNTNINYKIKDLLITNLENTYE
jgi:hypothetical protein